MNSITLETLPSVADAARAVQAGAWHILTAAEPIDPDVVFGTVASRLRATAIATGIPAGDLLDALDAIFAGAELLCLKQRAPLTLTSTARAILVDCRRFLLSH